MFTFVNLWELSEHKLFDDIRLPAGIDKEILINTIFDECAEFEPLTIDVDLMKAKINNFFARNYDNFNRLYQYTQIEYNPIENYSRYSNTTSNNTNENKISAYDSADYQNNMLTTDGNISSDHTHGNIGVTTTVQMLEEDTNYWNKYNMYKMIAEKFMFTLTISTL